MQLHQWLVQLVMYIDQSATLDGFPLIVIFLYFLLSCLVYSIVSLFMIFSLVVLLLYYRVTYLFVIKIYLLVLYCYFKGFVDHNLFCSNAKKIHYTSLTIITIIVQSITM